MASEETVNFVLWLKRTKRSAEATIAGKLECLKNLAKRVDLWDSEAVEDIVREMRKWGNAYKNRVLYAY